MTNSAAKTMHPWSMDSFLAKAQIYTEDMLSHSRDEWQYGLGSTFVLEFLGRAALAKVSPALLAEASSWNNIYFSLGGAPTTKKFVPKSIDITSVFSRLKEIEPSFTEFEGFAAQHVNRRNEELHSGATPFGGAVTSWLAQYYETCQVLLATMGLTLEFLFGVDDEQFAKELIAASHDESAKAVMKSVAAHKTVWESKDASALTHSDGAGRRASLARMVSAGLVQTKGLEDRLCSLM